MDRREFLGGTTGVSIALSLPVQILANDVPADITDLGASHNYQRLLNNNMSPALKSCRHIWIEFIDTILSITRLSVWSMISRCLHRPD